MDGHSCLLLCILWEQANKKMILNQHSAAVCLIAESSKTSNEAKKLNSRSTGNVFTYVSNAKIILS